MAGNATVMPADKLLHWLPDAVVTALATIVYTCNTARAAPASGASELGR